MRIWVGALLAAGLSLAGQARAETLPIDYILPARTDAAASVNRIAIERLDGNERGELRSRLADRLRGASFGPDPWFEIVPEGYAADADAILSGRARVDITTRDRDPKTVRKCEEKDDKGKCVKETERKVPCHNLAVSVNPDLGLVDRGGRELYRYDREQSEVRSYCDDQAKPSYDPMLDRMMDTIAENIAADLVPKQRHEDIRILENRKGLSKADADRFKNAVRLTKSDVDAACTEFAALAQANPSHGSSVFNLGLCSEMTGRTDSARHDYQRSLTLEGGNDYARPALARLDGSARADGQIAAHYGDTAPGAAQ